MHKTIEKPEIPDKEELLSYRYLLGEMGIQMLVAISRGANTKMSIQLLSGVPMACVKGRLPVLMNLKLVAEENEKYITTKNGHAFLNAVK